MLRPRRIGLIGTGAWAGLLCLLLAGCARPVEKPRSHSASVEQTTPDAPASETQEAPMQQRRLHLADMGIERWHQEGQRGQGVKIAILDSGFRDYRKFLGKGLPNHVEARSFRRDQNLEARDSQHGIFCSEVLHALAPDAEILLANWEPDSPQAFLEAARWAKSKGAKIISCSLIMPSWSDGEGGGEVHRRLQEILGDGHDRRDLLCFASAGNTAERHWCGEFSPDKAGWHRWRAEAIENTLRPWGPERVAVEFYGNLLSDYEVLVYRRNGGLIGCSELHRDATGTCSRAVVRFEPEADAVYDVRVRCVTYRSGDKSETFHLVILGGSLDCTTNHGSIPFPGDGASVIAVGAVNSQKERFAYSSCGPNSRLPKPDFVATVPFPSLCRLRPFAGTSAAAPQAAGLAALFWSRQPSSVPAQIIQEMREAALDLGPPGHDFATGYGLVRLPRP